MIFYFLEFTVALIVAFLTTPTIRYVALKFYVIDKKEKRKIHKKKVITKLGGAAIYAAFLFATAVGFLLKYPEFKPYHWDYGLIMIGATIILCLGIYDDVKEANAIVKVVTQTIAALVLIEGGFVIQSIPTPFGLIALGGWSSLFTVIFLVGITNSINLIDGMDGLAAGVVFIISIGLVLGIVTRGGSPFSALLAISLAGGTLGFLNYNFFPAKIFMGDTGSLFLGFMLGVIAIESTYDSSQIGFLVPLLALGFPISDTIFVVLRRIFSKNHPFKADKSHIHHLVSELGLSQRKVVLVLYLVTLSFVVISFLF